MCLKQLLIVIALVAGMGESGYKYSVLAVKPEGRRPRRKPRRRWEDNIKMVLKEVGWDIDWIDVAFVNAVMNFQLPQNAGECPD